MNQLLLNYFVQLFSQYTFNALSRSSNLLKHFPSKLSSILYDFMHSHNSVCFLLQVYSFNYIYKGFISLSRLAVYQRKLAGTGMQSVSLLIPRVYKQLTLTYTAYGFNSLLAIETRVVFAQI